MNLSAKLTIGLKNAAPYAPQSGPLGWWDISTVSANNNDTIDALADLTANNYDLVSAAQGFGPTYKTNIQNGLPAIYFAPASAEYLTESNMDQTQPFVIFMVGKIVDDEVINLGSVIEAPPILITTATTTLDMYAGTNVAVQTLDFTSAHVWTFIFNGASSYFREDGVQIGNAINPNTGKATLFTLGSLVAAQSHYMMEVIMYNSLIAPQYTEAYLMNKWGIS